MIITVNSLRKQLLQLQLLLRQTLMTIKQKEDIQSKISIIQEKLQDNTIEYDITNDQIEHTRHILKNNEGLQDIFRTFWYTCRGINTSASDTLDKGTYVKLFVALQHALLGYCQDDDATLNAEIDYNIDINKFGDINEIRFYDILFNYINCWCEFIDPSYVTMFTWTLLDAVIDIKYNPPKMRLLREIKRLTKVQNEAIMYESYLKNKNVITQLIIQEESLDRVALVQRKFLSRKARASFSGNKILMLEALVSRHNKSMRSNAYNNEQEIGDSDSDSDIGDNDDQNDQNDIAANMGTHSSSHTNTHETNTISTGSAASQYSKNQNKKRIVLPFAKNIDNDDKHYMVPLDRSITHRDKTVRFYTDSSLGKDEYTSSSDLHSYLINDLTDTKSSHGSFNDDSFLQVVNIDVKNEPKVRKKREIIQLETDDRPYSRPLQNLEPITVGLLPGSRSNSPTGSRPNIQTSDQLDQVDKLLAGPISPMSSPSSSPIIRVMKKVTKKKEPLMKVTQIDTKRMNLWSYSSYDLDLLDDEFLDNDDDISFATLSTYSDHRVQNAALNVITEKVRIKINQPDMAAMSKHPVTFPHDVFHDYVTVSLSSSDKVAASSQAWSHARAAKTVKSLPFHLQQRYKLSEKYSNKIDNDNGINKDKVSLSSIGIEPPRPDLVSTKTNLKNKLKALSFNNKSNTLHDDDMSLSSHDSDMISLIDHHVETLITDSNSLGSHSLLSKVDIDDNNDTIVSTIDIAQTYNDNFDRNSYNKEFVDNYNIYHNNRQPESSFNHDDEFTVYDGLLKERKRLIEKRIIALHRVAKQNMGCKAIHNLSGDLTINPRKVITFSRNDGRKNNNVNFDYRFSEKYDSNNHNKDDDDDASMASTISSLTYQRKDNDHITISPIGEAAIANYRGKNTKLKSNNLLAHLDGKYRQDNNKNRIKITTSNTDYVKLTDGDSLDLSLSEMHSIKSKKLKNVSHIANDDNDNPPPFVITSNKTKKRNQNIVKTNAAIPELNTNNGSDDNSVKSLVSSISSKTISSSSPWLPHPNVMNTSHSYIIHKSDRATSWKDNMLLLNYSPINPALTLTTVKCQDSLREVFELYSKKKYPTTTTRPLMQVGKKLNIKVNNDKK